MTPAWLLPQALPQFRVLAVHEKSDPETNVPMAIPRLAGTRVTRAVKLNRKIMRLHRNGKTVTQIMKRLRICRVTVWNHIKGNVSYVKRFS